MSIAAFLTASPRFLAFGFSASLFSSFGQTFFISLSGAEIRGAFGLSHGDFGLVYSAATLTSAGLLVWAGRKIDDVDLRPFTAIVGVGLGIACLAMTGIGGMAGSVERYWGVAGLIAVIFALRFTGQGLMSHVANVSMARYFDAHRGKALSVAVMGHPAGEAVLPFLVVTAIALIGWRQTWAAAGIAMIVLGVPFLLWLLKGHGERHRRLVETAAVRGAAGTVDDWSRRQVLTDPRFHVLLPSFVAMSFISTGFFFHQVHLVQTKGWSMALFAGFFVAFAIAKTLATLAAGILVDRFGGTRMMRVYLLPAVVGLVALGITDAAWVGALFMVAIGLTSGLGGVVHGAIWAELYGVRHLGAIKAMAAAMMVVSTALSPPVMGLAIDAGTAMETIAAASAVYILCAAALVTIALPRLAARN